MVLSILESCDCPRNCNDVLYLGSMALEEVIFPLSCVHLQQLLCDYAEHVLLNQEPPSVMVLHLIL